MADRGSLQLMGLLLAGATAGVILIAGTLVNKSTDVRLADRPPSWQAEQSEAFHRI
jgi:hypothetical protein